ncbi:peptidylprolyl isomerase [Deinococcus hopiensis]|uniref:peptidylprolyl isomerase n=1 Tax=Deinococcus hopiensis KR-140 TaxID=695939 RepID=A0A1W1VMG7_9DEIO|nr:peptidylprolyl isomerase [Deinococcus hopiensis]SMB94562.1 peptidyl-prolyl cis-trans isomerase C [Deinococcus hopiensis KR-140]
MKNKKVVNVLLGVLALMLVVGMAYQFTPNLGSLFGKKQEGTPALTVNGETVTAEDLESLRRGNQVLSSVTTGPLNDDFKTLVVAQKARQVAMTQAAKGIDVSRADVNAEVQKVREQNQLTDDKAWTDALQGAGLTDSRFRAQVRDQLMVQRKVEELKKTAQPATDAEARLYYDLHPDKFATEARIVGRQIVLDDKAKAAELLKQLKGGADFAALAAANSTDATTKARGGALGPIENGQPRAVAQVALPTEVGTAAFALQQGGLTDVLESGGKFYIVKVEKYLAPGTKPFDQAKADAVTAVNEAKKNAVVERWLTDTERAEKIEATDPNWKTQNPSVASVAGQDIPYSDVVAQIAGNEQFSSLLGQVPAEQAAPLVNNLLKPQVVEQLIAVYAAPKIAAAKKLALTGPRAEIAAALAAYGARDVKVTDSDIQAFYSKNSKEFETPASANVTEVSFTDRAQALAFRQSYSGGDVVTAAATLGGTVSERGEVAPGTAQTPGPLDPALESVVFTGKNFKSAGEGSLSEPLKVGQRFVVAYVTDLKKANVQPLAKVRSQIETQVLNQKKQEAGQAFLAKEVAALKPVNNLKKILADQAKRVAAAEPKKETPKAGTGSTGGAGSSTPATGGTKP